MVTTQHLVRIGTAGWNIPKTVRDRFPSDGSALERYARIFNCVEINSTFHRSHRPSTFERWAQSVPDGFEFSLKMPKEITHTRKLVDCEAPLEHFLAETAPLGHKREVILVQLPPKLAYHPQTAQEFFGAVRSMYQGRLALEPRHPTWFTEDVNLWLDSIGVCRVAADPAPVPEAAKPGGSKTLTYIRLHGSPRTYYSSYTADSIEQIAQDLSAAPRPWCIFDNTAGGAAAGDALALLKQLGAGG